MADNKQAFVISINFKTPIYLGQDPVYLDAIIAGLLMDEGQIDDPADIPFQDLDGIPLASQLFADTIALEGEAQKARAYRDNEIPLGRIDMPENQKLQDSTVDRYDNILNRYSFTAAGSGVFIGTGDIEEIESLLQDVSAIGKRRSDGWGMIEEFAIEAAEAAPEYWGLTDRDGNPARCVPGTLWEKISNITPELIDVVRPRPFYWDEKIPREACVMPADGNLERLVL